MQIKLVEVILYLVLLHPLAVEAVVGIPALQVQLVALVEAELLLQLLVALVHQVKEIMVKLAALIKEEAVVVLPRLAVQMAQVKVVMV